MCFILTQKVLNRNIEITSTQKLILIVLSDYADSEGSNIFPSYETIAKKTRLSRRSVINNIKELKKLKYIYTDSLSDYKTNNFYINISLIENSCSIDFKDSERDSPTSEIASPPSERDSLPPVKQIHPLVNELHRGGERDSPKYTNYHINDHINTNNLLDNLSSTIETQTNAPPDDECLLDYKEEERNDTSSHAQTNLQDENSQQTKIDNLIERFRSQGLNKDNIDGLLNYISIDELISLAEATHAKQPMSFMAYLHKCVQTHRTSSLSAPESSTEDTESNKKENLSKRTAPPEKLNSESPVDEIDEQSIHNLLREFPNLGITRDDVVALLQKTNMREVFARTVYTRWKCNSGNYLDFLTRCIDQNWEIKDECYKQVEELNISDAQKRCRIYNLKMGSAALEELADKAAKKVIDRDFGDASMDERATRHALLKQQALDNMRSGRYYVDEQTFDFVKIAA